MKKLSLVLLALFALTLAGSALAYPSCSDCNCQSACNQPCYEFGTTVLTTCGAIDEGTGPCVDSFGCNWNPFGGRFADGSCDSPSSTPMLEEGTDEVVTDEIVETAHEAA